jgi:hypothetical protein
MAERPAERGKLANVVALTMALTTSVVLYVLPVGTRETATVGSDGTETRTVESIRLPEMAGAGELAIVALLLVPPAITALPLVFRNRGLALASAGLLTLLCFLAGFSIGLFYVPAAIAMWVSARRSAAA